MAREIGRGCLVGARALVTEGKIFPDHSLIIGSPAKAVRTLDGAATEALRGSAPHYVENWHRFASGLHRIDGESAGRVREARVGAGTRRRGMRLRISTAIPFLSNRTTCAGVEPIVTRSPIAGRTSTATAAPDRETSISLAANSRPFVNVIVVPDCAARSGRVAGLPAFRVARDWRARSTVRRVCRAWWVVVSSGSRSRQGTCGRPISLDAAEVVKIDDDAFAWLDADVGREGDAARRHVDRRAIEFVPIGAHEPSVTQTFTRSCLVARRSPIR